MDTQPQVSTGHPRRWIILGVLCAALCIIIIDETILYIAVPALFEGLGATNGQVQWAIDAYVLVYAALLLPAGNLGDRYGRRTFLLLGLAIFGLASIAAAGAPDAGMLIAARIVMAIGGALIMPQTLSIITEVFAPSERGLAIGVWSGVSGIGIVAGPIAGGLLLQHFWWGSVFLVNLPIVAVAMLGAATLLPNHRDPTASPVDVPGSVLAVIALLGLLGAVIEGPARGISSPIVWGAGVAGLAAAIGFVVVERSRTRPMFDLALLKVPRVGICLGVIAGSFAALQGSSYALTQYLQLVQGRGAAETGLLFAPTTIAWSSAAVVSPWALRRWGMRRLLVVTMVVTGASYLALVFIGISAPVWFIIVDFAVLGVAMGLSTTPVTDVMMGFVEPERSGIASALNDMSRQIGGATGVAVFGAVLGAVFVAGVGPGGPENLGAAVTSGSARVLAEATDAFMSGFRWTMIVATVLLGALIPLVLRWPCSEPSGRDPGAA